MPKVAVRRGKLTIQLPADILEILEEMPKIQVDAVRGHDRFLEVAAGVLSKRANLPVGGRDEPPHLGVVEPVGCEGGRGDGGDGETRCDRFPCPSLHFLSPGGMQGFYPEPATSFRSGASKTPS